jgi:hypothetical protein
MARKKIHKVTIREQEYFIYAETKQGAVRDVLASLKSEVKCEVATGEDLFYHGMHGGKIIGEPEPESPQNQIEFTEA